MINKLEKILKKIQTKQINKNQLIYLLDNYYQCVIYKIDELTDEEIYEKEDESFPEELVLPLENRKSGILEALNLVLQMNPNVNENTDSENALMIAVGNADSFIVEYLLEKGANPLKWPNPEEDETNYYLNDLDIHYMNYSFENRKDEIYEKALFNTANSLVSKGNLPDYQGYCLSVIDSVISFNPCEKKF